jgi:hypothetical protein
MLRSVYTLLGKGLREPELAHKAGRSDSIAMPLNSVLILSLILRQGLLLP